MAEGGANYQVATVSVPFKADMEQFDRDVKDIEDRISKIPEKFKASLEEVSRSFENRIDEWKKKVDEISSSLSQAQSEQPQFSGQVSVGGDKNDVQELQTLEDVKEELKTVNASLNTIKGMLVNVTSQ